MPGMRICFSLALILSTECATAAFAQTSAPAPTDRGNAEHYVWGGVNDGWYMVQRPDMAVILERIVPGSGEVRHYHSKSRQFFYVLSGDFTMEAGGQTHLLHPGQGIEIPPGVPHQAQNHGTTPVEILVSSTPPSHGDRTDAPIPTANP